jgi:RNA 3'-terminal phosphate cyclase (ATP)
METFIRLSLFRIGFQTEKHLGNIKNNMLVINGAYGEGGGEILRTSLTLATILTKPIRIDNIRAGRERPGLAAQHLTAVRAAAMICDAHIVGDKLGSTQLIFEPQSPPIAGSYEFDVAEAREGGSAGAATLILQTVLVPLALTKKVSTVTVRGGTHVPWSPSFHYLHDVYLPAAASLGVQATAKLLSWGWYPIGDGEITITVSEKSALGYLGQSAGTWQARGPLKEIRGLAVASSLPAHIAQRMRNRAFNLLEQAGLPATIEPQRVRSASPGAGIFLTSEYESIRAGFDALGRKGKPAEQVAEEAVNDLLAFHYGDATLDKHLADQLILLLALSGLSGSVKVEQLTPHAITNLWVVEQFLGSITKVDHKRGLIHFIGKDRDLL